MRELDRWASEHAAVDLDDLYSSGYQSAEIWFARWPRPFPTRVRRRMVEHLIRIHDQWLPQLQRLQEPFYLGVWLFEPGLTESQVVAAVGERGADYRARHHPEERSSPPGLYAGYPEDLGRFEWTRHIRVERDWLSLYAESDWPNLLQRARRVERIDGDVAVTLEYCEWRAVLRAPY
jgi:hypothetical protein